MNEHEFAYKLLIKECENFPKPGILFRDISPLLANYQARSTLIAELAMHAWKAGTTHVMGLDARGFIIGSMVADALKLPFVMARKPGKLPGRNVTVKYELEYGNASLDVPLDAFKTGISRVMVADDLLATGGTAEAAAIGLASQGVEVSLFGFVIELKALKGRERLNTEFGAPIHSAVSYE